MPVAKLSESQRPRSAVVANLSAPEINQLSVELERRELLRWYVRRYVNKQRHWERLLSALPSVGGLYRQTLGRRAPPLGLPVHRIVEAGVTSDFMAAGIARLGAAQGQWKHRMVRDLHFETERHVALKAADLAADAQLVVASYGTGQFAFETVRRAGGHAVLSYPIAHNDYQAKFYAEEAGLEPSFAAALPRLNELPSEYSERLNIECELADRILVGSSFVRHSFIVQGYDAAKISVVPYGVDATQFAPPTGLRQDGVFRVLFVGQIGQRKGMSYLLKGYQRFKRPDSELHIVGSFVSGEEVYHTFANLFRYQPNVPHGDLRGIFQQADVFLFPSLIEGMPLVVLEAMACGLPVIATPRGCEDIVRDGIDGFLVPIRDPDAIAARLEDLYRDPALREEMGRNARQQALRHSWQTYARSAVDVALQ